MAVSSIGWYGEISPRAAAREFNAIDKTGQAVEVVHSKGLDPASKRVEPTGFSSLFEQFSIFNGNTHVQYAFYFLDLDILSRLKGRRTHRGIFRR